MYDLDFFVTLPHPELGTEEELFTCTFEYESESEDTDVSPGWNESCTLVEAYASISGPVERSQHFPQAEILRIEKEALAQLKNKFAEEFSDRF
jgi:hypothetical protein